TNKERTGMQDEIMQSEVRGIAVPPGSWDEARRRESRAGSGGERVGKPDTFVACGSGLCDKVRWFFLG
ncbi:MAG: hypothetical protein WCD06_18230, partial [Candidatus Sulfotelmatobacter sp.]